MHDSIGHAHGRYEGVGAMLERYAELRTLLNYPRSTWPDPERTRDGGAHPSDVTGRLQVEAADIAKCVKAAKLGRNERLVLRCLIRPRLRECRRCEETFTADSPTCPACGANRLHGWTYEPFPTGPAVVQELNARNGQVWTIHMFYGARERAYGSLERVMRRRHMLG